MTGTEVELKIALPEADAEALSEAEWLNGLRTGAPRVQNLVSTYFDTPDLALYTAGSCGCAARMAPMFGA